MTYERCYGQDRKDKHFLSTYAMPAALKEYMKEESQLDERKGEIQEGFLGKGAFEMNLED